METLDALDDDIVAANDLLHRIGNWRSAWEREQAPLRDSLEAVEGALMRAEGDTTERSPQEQDAVDALRVSTPGHQDAWQRTRNRGG